MSVGLRAGGIWTELGSSDLVHALFSTISYHLESNKWGSKYPYLLNKLYNDKLDSEEISYALEELKDINTKLVSYKFNEIIWDVQDLARKPDESFLTKLNSPNLSQSFKTIRGRNFFDVFIEVLEFCKKRGMSVKIQNENELVK